LAARDLLLQGLDVCFLKKKKARDPGDYARFIAANDSEGGGVHRRRQETGVRRQESEEWFWAQWVSSEKPGNGGQEREEANQGDTLCDQPAPTHGGGIGLEEFTRLFE